MFPTIDLDIPYLTTEQMIEVDRLMMENYHIDLPRMMESAGRNLAHLARGRFFDGNPRGKRVVVLAGTGGNGGGALVAARRLHNYGAQVTAYVTKAHSDFTPVPAEQYAMLERIGVTIHTPPAPESLPDADLILDGVIGYNLKGDPRGVAADLIRLANDSDTPILSLDAPSGVDTTTGTVHTPAIRATATMTLALPKIGLKADGVREVVGDLYLADISVPRELYAEPSLGLDVGPIFASSDIVRLW